MIFKLFHVVYYVHPKELLYIYSRKTKTSQKPKKIPIKMYLPIWFYLIRPQQLHESIAIFFRLAVSFTRAALERVVKDTSHMCADDRFLDGVWFSHKLAESTSHSLDEHHENYSSNASGANDRCHHPAGKSDGCGWSSKVESTATSLKFVFTKCRARSKIRVRPRKKTSYAFGSIIVDVHSRSFNMMRHEENERRRQSMQGRLHYKL